MLNLYRISRRQGGPFVGSLYCGQSGSRRVLCVGRYSAVRDYLKTLEVVEWDTLAGRNPFVPAAYAASLRALSRFNAEDQGVGARAMEARAARPHGSPQTGRRPRERASASVS